MTHYALPAPKIGDEGLPLILAGVAVTGIALAALVWWGMKNKKETDQAQPVATR